MRDTTMTEKCSISLNISDTLQSDPIGLDLPFQTGVIAELNRSRDKNGLLEIAKRSVDISNRGDELSVEEKWAAIRDYGIIIGSLVRHEADPLNEVDHLKETISLIGHETDMPPYHTVFHYAMLNPHGIRERSFTGSIQEKIFIEQVRVGFNNFIDSATLLFPLYSGETGLDSKDALARMKNASAHIDIGISTIPKVMKEVGSEYFAKELRPYFNPLLINGASYDAPGGAQMPMLAVDHALWASDTRDADYILFRDRNLKYLPQFIRVRITESLGRPSLKSQITDSGLMYSPIGKSLTQIITRILSFRKAHEKLAKDSFSHRGENAYGSGGANPELLENLSKITRSQINEL